MIIRFYGIDGDTYDGKDIDLSFKTFNEAKAAYDRINAPYKVLRGYGYEGTIDYETFKDCDFYKWLDS